MSKDTHIEWCDSSLNLMMGCDGCELWNQKAGVKHCYAGDLTKVYGGRKGWPKNFETPALFVERLDAALKWSDLTGNDRPEKPWLNGMPHMIFLNDMGDTFTESLPIDWLAPLLPRLADSPHIWMILTKRGARLEAFSKMCQLPTNVWPGVSVTTQATTKRIESLLGVRGGGVKWVSAEPLLGPVVLSHRFNDGCVYSWLDGQFRGLKVTGENGNPDFTADTIEPSLPKIGWVIVGGESGAGARPCDVAWIRSLVKQCREAETPCFVKQLGSNPVVWDDVPFGAPWDQTIQGRIFLRDKKGGDPAEWPADLRVREMPQREAVTHG